MNSNNNSIYITLRGRYCFSIIREGIRDNNNPSFSVGTVSELPAKRFPTFVSNTLFIYWFISSGDDAGGRRSQTEENHTRTYASQSALQSRSRLLTQPWNPALERTEEQINQIGAALLHPRSQVRLIALSASTCIEWLKKRLHVLHPPGVAYRRGWRMGVPASFSPQLQ